MSTVVGLDLSLTNAGIAVLTDGRPTLLRSVGHGGHNGASHAHRSRRIVSQTRAVLAEIAKKPGVCPDCGGVGFGHSCTRSTPPSIDMHLDLAVIEGPAYSMLARPSGHDIAGLWWGVYSALLAKQIPIAVIPPTSLKIWTTGKGNATKDRMLAEVRTWWPVVTVANDDIGDALALATVGAFHLGEAMPFEVKSRHETALAKVEWPVGV